MNNNNNITPPAPPAAPIKKPKVKGPIRTEAVVPISIIFLITFIYFHFAFDMNLKSLIEWGGTYVHGAEVNVSSLRTSFIGGSFSLKGLEVTDKEMPARNLVKLGEIRFHFLWDALLRAKFVVADAGIDGIEIYSPRKSPGYVKPPEPPQASGLAANDQKVLDQTKTTEGQADGGLDQVSKMIEGGSDGNVAADIRGNLKSEARIKELEAELKEKEKVWQERLSKLPQKEEFSALVNRAKALKFDTKNPKEFASDIKEIGKIKKEADEKISTFKTMSKDLKADVDKYNEAFRSIDDLVKQDMKDLESQMKLPNLESGDLSNSIYGKMFGGKLVALQRYMLLVRKYMPPAKDKNAKQDEALLPHARGAGKTYRFKVTTGYPLFWLKHSSISSEPTSEGFAGKVKGSLTNVTSDPTFVGKPAVLDVAGDFPKSDIHNTQLKVTIDHVNEPKEMLELRVGHFPVYEKALLSGSSVGLTVKKASGSSVMSAQLVDRNVNLELRNEFKQIDYDLKANSKTVKEALTSILAGIPVITLNATASGSWDHLSLHLNSNLGSELSQGLKKYVQARIDQMRAKIKDSIESKIKPQKDKLSGDFNKLKGQTDDSLKSRSKELDQAKNDVDGAEKTGGGGGTKKDKLKKEGLKLLKGFKF